MKHNNGLETILESVDRTDNSNFILLGRKDFFMKYALIQQACIFC